MNSPLSRIVVLNLYQVAYDANESNRKEEDTFEKKFWWNHFFENVFVLFQTLILFELSKLFSCLSCYLSILRSQKKQRLPLKNFFQNFIINIFFYLLCFRKKTLFFKKIENWKCLIFPLKSKLNVFFEKLKNSTWNFFFVDGTFNIFFPFTKSSILSNFFSSSSSLVRQDHS